MTFKLTKQKTGEGTPSASHSSIVYLPDNNGYYREVNANLTLFRNGRTIGNILADDSDYSGWLNYYISSKVYADGSTKITSSATTNPRIYKDLGVGYAIGGLTFAWSVEMWTDAGQPTDVALYLYDLSAGSVQYANCTLTETPTRFVVIHTFPSGETDTTLRYRIDLSETSTGYLYAKNGLLESLTSRDVLTAPSEFVAGGVLDTYNCTNGNTVDANNVVTDAVGTLFSANDYYLHNVPAYTNIIRYSRLETTTTPSNKNRWYLANSCTVSSDQTSIQGSPNQAATLTWGASNSSVSQLFDVSTGDTITATLWIKKTTSASTYPGIGLYRNSGTPSAEQSTAYIFNTDDGSYTARSGFNGYYSSIEAEQIGNFWRVILHHAYADPPAATADQYAIYIQPSAATSSAPTTWDVSNSGSCIIGQVQVGINKTIADARSVGPIFNTGTSTVTVGASSVTWDGDNHNDTEGGYVFEIDWQGGAVDILSLGGAAFLYTEVLAKGTELVTNGDFTTDTTGWTASNSTLSKVTFDSRSNVLSVADNGGWSQAKQAITTVAGATYIISGVRHNNNVASNGYIAIYDGDTTGSASTADGDVLAEYTDDPPAASADWETFELEFIAQSTTTTIAPGGTGANTAYFDDISVKAEGTQLTLSDGTNSVSTDMTVGEHRIGTAHGSSKLRLSLDDAWGSEGTYDGSFGTGDLSTEATIRELKFKKGSYADVQDAVDDEVAIKVTGDTQNEIITDESGNYIEGA